MILEMGAPLDERLGELAPFTPSGVGTLGVPLATNSLRPGGRVRKARHTTKSKEVIL